MKRILIVDDSEMARMSLRFGLQSMKYEVLDAGNGKEAINQIKANSDIGLIITDVNMPEMNGLELVEHLKQNPNLNKIPIIAITTDEIMGNEMVIKGATAFVVKSKNTSEKIHEFVRKYLEGTPPI